MDRTTAPRGVPRKRGPAESGQVGKEHMVGVSDDGIANGSSVSAGAKIPIVPDEKSPTSDKG
jgi:hypothetical protein